jgi:hypothetical protein
LVDALSVPTTDSANARCSETNPNSCACAVGTRRDRPCQCAIPVWPLQSGSEPCAASGAAKAIYAVYKPQSVLAFDEPELSAKPAFRYTCGTRHVQFDPWATRAATAAGIATVATGRPSASFGRWSWQAGRVFGVVARNKRQPEHARRGRQQRLRLHGVLGNDHAYDKAGVEGRLPARAAPARQSQDRPRQEVGRLNVSF